MARPKGTKYIETPQHLWFLFVKYKELIKSKPKLVQDYVGKDAEMVYREKEVPLTMTGFECFVLDNVEKMTCPDLTEYFEGKNESYKDYFPIASRIRKEIENDLTIGGLTMVYSQSITARITGLSDKQEIEHKVKESTPIFLNNPLLGKVKDE